MQHWCQTHTQCVIIMPGFLAKKLAKLQSMCTCTQINKKWKYCTKHLTTMNRARYPNEPKI
jgi:hypothetical protein